MNRKLTKQEKDWLIRGLKTLATGEYHGGGQWVDGETGKLKPLDKIKDPEPFLKQIDELRVVHKCKCDDPDCHTVHFQHFERGKCGAIVVIQLKDGRGRMLIIDVHKESKMLAGLEVI